MAHSDPYRHVFSADAHPYSASGQPHPSENTHEGLPILGVVASDIEGASSDDSNAHSMLAAMADTPVLGTPVYDRIGYVFHKGRLLWRKRLLAIQNQFLLFFTSDEGMRNNDPKFIIDLRHQVRLQIDVEENGLALTCPGTTFTLSGYGMPHHRDMHFQAHDPTECQRWCNALRLAIFGRCHRCLLEPAMFRHYQYEQHRHCLHCARHLRSELLRQRHDHLVQELHAMSHLLTPLNVPSSAAPTTTATADMLTSPSAAATPLGSTPSLVVVPIEDIEDASRIPSPTAQNELLLDSVLAARQPTTSTPLLADGIAESAPTSSHTRRLERCFSKEDLVAGFAQPRPFLRHELPSLRSAPHSQNRRSHPHHHGKARAEARNEETENTRLQPEEAATSPRLCPLLPPI